MTLADFGLMAIGTAGISALWLLAAAALHDRGRLLLRTAGRRQVERGRWGRV